MTLGRRDAFLYLAAATLGSFGLGVAAFYLNFLYRSLGYDGVALGALVGAVALGVVIGAVPAATIARGRSRRTVILSGGVLAGFTFYLFQEGKTRRPVSLNMKVGARYAVGAGIMVAAAITLGGDHMRAVLSRVGTAAVFLGLGLAGVPTPSAARAEYSAWGEMGTRAASRGTPRSAHQAR